MTLELVIKPQEETKIVRKKSTKGNLKQLTKW